MLLIYIFPDFTIHTVGFRLAGGDILDLEDTLNGVKQPVGADINLPIVLGNRIVHTCPSRMTFAFHCESRVVAGTSFAVADALEDGIGSVTDVV